MSDRTLIEKSRERFVHETAEHQMEIVRDDGVDRHLRFAKPGTGMYHFDIVTWPGYLAVVGDCGDFVFSRLRDMFEFFGDKRGFADERWGINPQYWAEKLRAPKSDAVRTYSFEAYEARVREWLADALREDLDDCVGSGELEAAAHDQLLDDPDHEAYHDEVEAHRRLRDFEHQGRRIHDSWEWDLREYDWQFLWCCWAIVWGIEQYQSSKPAPVGAAA